MNRRLSLLAILSLVLISSSLMAQQIILDDVMTKEERQRIGIDKLTLDQKLQLETWLNQNFVLKPKGQPQQAQLFLSINIDDGQKLQLSDNSIWEIAPNDVSTAAVWITPFPVKITSSNDPEYPSLLVNLNSGASVKAKKLPIPNVTQELDSSRVKAPEVRRS